MKTKEGAASPPQPHPKAHGPLCNQHRPQATCQPRPHTRTCPGRRQQGRPQGAQLGSLSAPHHPRCRRLAGCSSNVGLYLPRKGQTTFFQSRLGEAGREIAAPLSRRRGQAGRGPHQTSLRQASPRVQTASLLGGARPSRGPAPGTLRHFL